jgi:uncharacterized protein (DUF1330 family)
MKIRYTMALAIAIALGLGVFATRGLTVEVTRTVYVVTELDEITDADSYEALKKTDPTAAAETRMVDGRYLARTGNITALDGTAPKAIAIIAFDNEAKARAYYKSAKEITATRMKAAKSRSFIVEVCLYRGKLTPDC